jgi:hypothetical protein
MNEITLWIMVMITFIFVIAMIMFLMTIFPIDYNPWAHCLNQSCVFT